MMNTDGLDEIIRIADLMGEDEGEDWPEPVDWPIQDGMAVRPDGIRFTVEKTRTMLGDRLYVELGGDVAAIHEVNRRIAVRVVRAWGEPGDERPGGDIEVSLDGGAWTLDDGYILSRVPGQF